MIDLTMLEVAPGRLVRVLREHLAGDMIAPSAPGEFGPAGLKVVLSASRNGLAVGSVIVTQADHEDITGASVEWIHASLAWRDSMPSYADLVALKDAVFGPDREAYQIFPLAGTHVNIHEYALHLWGRADGVPALPDFTRGGVTI